VWPAFAHSPVCEQFRCCLFDDHEVGWKSLQDQGLAAIFHSTCLERNWPEWENTAQGFYDFCVDAAGTAPLGDDLLFCLLEVMEKAEAPAQGAKIVLRPPTLQVLLAFCAVGIERWVNHKDSGVPPPPPDLGSGISLHLDEPWAVYHVAAAAFRRKSRMAAQAAAVPSALIMVNEPAEGISGDVLKPVRAALDAAYRGVDAVKPAKTPSTRFIKGNMGAIKAKLQCDPILGVRFGDVGNPLLNMTARSAAFMEFGVPTVEFGDIQTT
jgi:hypothetical protein